jgi:hypothetical protein
MIPMIACGLVWFFANDYQRIKKMMADRHVFPSSYDDWRRRAEQDERMWQSKGITTVRAYIDPAEFTRWCAINNRLLDAKARAVFAAEKARSGRPAALDWGGVSSLPRSTCRPT